MKTYLFVWNPKLWDWDNLNEMSADVKNGKDVFDRWGTGTSRKIKQRDRFFIIRLGAEPRGIFASGEVASDVFEDIHSMNQVNTRSKGDPLLLKFDAL
jgi:5-methylcytosine-specific restriction protein A